MLKCFTVINNLRMDKKVEVMIVDIFQSAMTTRTSHFSVIGSKQVSCINEMNLCNMTHRAAI